MSWFFVQPLDVQPLLDAGLLSSLVLVLHRLLSSAVSASSVTAPLTTFDGLKLTDDIGDERRRAMVEGGVVHIMKALAQHPVAAQSLAEDDSLQLMFHMIALGGTIPMLSHSDSFKKIAATTPPLHLAQLHRHVMQVLASSASILFAQLQTLWIVCASLFGKVV
jgi:hypothetical protein